MWVMGGWSLGGEDFGPVPPPRAFPYRAHDAVSGYTRDRVHIPVVPHTREFAPLVSGLVPKSEPSATWLY